MDFVKEQTGYKPSVERCARRSGARLHEPFIDEPRARENEGLRTWHIPCRLRGMLLLREDCVLFSPPLQVSVREGAKCMLNAAEQASARATAIPSSYPCCSHPTHHCLYRFERLLIRCAPSRRCTNARVYGLTDYDRAFNNDCTTPSLPPLCLYYTWYIGWVGVGWQRRCKTCHSLHELDYQGTVFCCVFWRSITASGRVK